MRPYDYIMANRMWIEIMNTPLVDLALKNLLFEPPYYLSSPICWPDTEEALGEVVEL